MSINTWILTCAPEHRKQEVVQLLEAAGHDPEYLLTITAEPRAIRPQTIPGRIITFPERPLNISEWWNLGAEFIDNMERGNGNTEWNIIYMESDARLSARDVDLLQTALRTHDVGMAGSDWQHALTHDDVRRGLNDLHPYRLPGFALMVRGELGLRHDPDMRWWFSDDDFEWTARANHGTVLVAGAELYHVGTDGLDSPDKQTYAVEDEIKFKSKWNILPSEVGH